MTYAEFENKYIGVPVDFDGVAGVQCVDLVDQYLKDCFGIEGVWCNGAKDLYNKFSSYPALVAAFNRVPNTPDLIVREGDIVIWGGGSWGHTGIGTGHGTVDWFITLEENTLGQHEPTQLVKHWFANDIANPCLGVLRPKTSAPEILDDEGLKNGDKGLAVLMYKQLLIIAKNRGIIRQTVKNDGGFGDGTEIATNELLKHLGYEQNGIAGVNLAKKLGVIL